MKAQNGVLQAQLGMCPVLGDPEDSCGMGLRGLRQNARC